MLSNLVGPIDLPAATFLCVLCFSVAVITTTLIAKRRSRLTISNEHELAKIKLANEQALATRRDDQAQQREMAKIADYRVLEEQRIGQNMITSHSRVNDE